MYQVDVKCAFFKGVLKKTIYVEQPPGIVNDKFHNHFYILNKVVYRSKQLLHAWYATLTNFLKIAKLNQGSSDPTLF